MIGSMLINKRLGQLYHYSQWLAFFTSKGFRRWMLAGGVVILAYIVWNIQFNARNYFFNRTSPKVEKNEMRLHGFSPDNRLLSFDFCRGPKCFAGLLNLNSAKVTKIVPPNPDEWWFSGRFSPSGKYLAFAIKRKSENFRWSQLGLYEISAGTHEIITHTESLRDFPSFSPDEKRLIYAQANRERISGKTRFSRWDIYELDISSRVERRLTDCQFFIIGHPSYLPDGRQFIFSGEAPRHFSGKVRMDAYDAYKEKYDGNTIFILGPEYNTELRPAFINGPATLGPDISKDGKHIAYMARSDDLDRAAGITVSGYAYDIFMFEGGRHRRLTNLKDSLGDYTMSQDGSFIAYTSDPEGNGEIQLWLLDVAQNEVKRIEITMEDLKKSLH